MYSLLRLKYLMWNFRISKLLKLLNFQKLNTAENGLEIFLSV